MAMQADLNHKFIEHRANTLLREFDALKHPERHQVVVQIGDMALKAPEYELQDYETPEAQAQYIARQTFRPLMRSLGGKSLKLNQAYPALIVACDDSLHSDDADDFGLEVGKKVNVTEILPPKLVVDAMFVSIVMGDRPSCAGFVNYIRQIKD